ncbi:sigma factor-like helix-turn-helix DNA-binding protein [Streptomyces sp. NPDC002262]|uniref:sigma factor-like helix-turn-helix DNA-binding protein n=1 Tax=Streptomyces sp. NPDC002262 TaxID=3154414 RepID=UPI0033299913
MARYQSRVNELPRIRREAIEEAQATGMTQAEIAKRLGVSRGRVGQLASAGPRPSARSSARTWLRSRSAASTRWGRLLTSSPAK